MTDTPSNRAHRPHSLLTRPAQPTRDQMIDFLVDSIGDTPAPAMPAASEGPDDGITQRLLRRMARTRTLPVAPQARYWTMSDAQLHALYTQECQRRIAAAQAESAGTEPAGQGADEPFFSGPEAAADIDSWARAEWWTLDEAVALLLDKSPDVVRWHRLEPMVPQSSFAQWFSMVRRLAMRANLNWQMEGKVRPAHFLEWAQVNDFPIPERLFEQVTVRDRAHSDWRGKFEKAEIEIVRLQAELTELRTKAETAAREFTRALETAREEAAASRAHAERIESAAETRIRLMAKEAGKARASLLARVQAERDALDARLAELEALLDTVRADEMALAVPPLRPADADPAIRPNGETDVSVDRLLH